MSALQAYFPGWQPGTNAGAQALLGHLREPRRAPASEEAASRLGEIIQAVRDLGPDTRLAPDVRIAATAAVLPAAYQLRHPLRVLEARAALKALGGPPAPPFVTSGGQVPRFSRRDYAGEVRRIVETSALGVPGRPDGTSGGGPVRR